MIHELELSMSVLGQFTIFRRGSAEGCSITIVLTLTRAEKKRTQITLEIRDSCVVCDLWFVVCGLWFVVCGLWFVVRGSWFVVRGSWSVICVIRDCGCGEGKGAFVLRVGTCATYIK